MPLFQHALHVICTLGLQLYYDDDNEGDDDNDDDSEDNGDC